MAAPKIHCHWCGRMIAPRRFTIYLRPHKWDKQRAREQWPNLSEVGDWCPGGKQI